MDRIYMQHGYAILYIYWDKGYFLKAYIVFLFPHGGFFLLRPDNSIKLGLVKLVVPSGMKIAA